MKVITETRRTRWRLLQKHVVLDEGYYRNTSYQMKVITETRRTRCRLLQKHVVPDEGYYRNTSYQMKVITETRRTRWSLLQKQVVPDESYYRKNVVPTRLVIYAFNNNIPCLYIQPTTTIVAMTTSIPPVDIAKYMYILSKVAVCPKNTRKRLSMLVL